jgi:hypothetical protein
MTTKKSIKLHLDPVTLNKIKRMQQSISEPTTYGKIISGLIDMGYASALDILYADGLISKNEYYKGVLELPDYLQKNPARVNAQCISQGLHKLTP